MAVNESLASYDAVTASNNTPSGGTAVGTELDDHIRDVKKNVGAASRFIVQAAKTAAYTCVTTDHNTVIQVDATATATIVVSLLASATAGDGWHVFIKKTSQMEQRL